jgi:choline dehydrogenase-like flavoprotein
MTQSRTAPDDTETLDCDICIIGAGAAGVSVALGLIGSCERVLLLDAGELHGKQTDTSLYEGEVINPAHALPHMYRHRRLGGSTAIWGGRCIPFDAIDFERRDYVRLSGWPISRETLEPHYGTAQSILEAGTFDYSALSSLPGSELISQFRDVGVLTDSIERFSLPTNVWREHRRSIIASANVQLVAGSTAIRLKREETGRVSQIECVNGRGGRFVVKARTFVVAVGGLETVRLLGFSGLGDDSGMLGRTYMCHVESSLGELRLKPGSRAIEHGFETTRDGVYARRRFTLSPERQRALGILNVAVRPHHPSVGDPAHGHPVLSAMFLAKRFIIPEYARRFAAASGGETPVRLVAQHIRNAILGSPTLLAFTVDWTRRRYLSRRRIPYVALPSAAGVFPLDFNGEQEPNLDSRVTLSDALDRHGVPKLRIDWRLTELDYRTVGATLNELRRSLRNSGCGDLGFDEGTLQDDILANVKPVGGHHIGTARMSDDPKQGVVNADAQVHGVPNLYVASSAVFPTSSHANPTLTIVALAARLAEHLKAGASHHKRF